MAHESDGMNLRRVGLTLAAVSALAAIGVVVWAAAFRAPAPSGPTAEPLVNPLPGGVGDAEETAAASPEPERLGDLVQSAEDAELQFFDPEDESLRGKMTFARLDPQPNGRFYAERPEAWLLLGNGTSARITAAETNFRMPAGSGEPESGRFTGDVRVEVHRGRLETDEAQSASEAAATFLMDELHFDAALGQVRTTSEVRVLARGVEGSFSGLEAVIDEVGRRLSHLSTRGGGWLERTRVSEAADGGEEDAGAARERDGDAAEDLYLARFDGGVTVEQGASSVRSDQLELWARLVGGGLPEDALGEFLTVSGGGASAGGGDREDDAAGDAPAAIRWEGRLVVRPLDESPEPLERDALAGRFSSPSTGLVEIVDGASGAEATCASATYGATSRRLTLTGPGSTGVAFRAPETGELVCGRMEIDLTTGRVVMPGAGELRAASPDARAAARTVSWQRGASADLATSGEHVDLSGRWPIERAVFEGGATAREGEAEVTGERLEAVFARVEGGEGTLERVVVEPARRRPGRRFVVAGPQYPGGLEWPANVERIEHLPPAAHRGFYCAQRATVNVTRAAMRRMGHAPSVRLFEAAACGTAIVSDRWEGLDELLSPGEELLLAETPEESLAILDGMSDAELTRIGAAARERVLASHTARRRAEELIGHLEAAGAGACAGEARA